MAQVGLALDFTGYTGDLIVVWKKATTPLAEVDRSDALPFPVSQIVTAANLTDESYIFEFWQSSDGTTLDTLLRSWAVDASAYSGALATTYTYVVDRGDSLASVWADPVDADTSISDTRLLGAVQDDLIVERRGTGPLRHDEYSLLAGGGIQLEVAGDIFSSGDTIFVTVFRKVSSGISPSTDYVSALNVDASANVDSTFKNKLINVTSSATLTTLTFPGFVTMADQKMKIVTQGMTGKTLALHFTIDTIFFEGEDRSTIYLGKSQMIEILISGGVGYILDDKTGYEKQGKRELVEKIGLNQLAADGTEYDTVDYPFWVEYLNTLSPTQVFSNKASWNTTDNKHFHYLNTTLGKFALPDDRDIFYRALTGSDIAGRYQADMVGPHTHPGVPLKINDIDRGGSGSGYSIDNDSNTGLNSGTETRPKNVGMIAVINIA